MNGYGISSRTITNSWVDETAEDLQRLGYSVVRDVLDADVLGALRDKLEQCYQRQAEEFGGESLLESIKDKDVLRLPLAYDEAFMGAATAPRVLEICSRVLGENFVLIMQNGLINHPDVMHEQRNWHRDLNYQHWVISKPIAVNVLICLDDFVRENGATFVLPASHLIAEFPSDAFVRRHEIQIEAPAGAAIVLDAMTFHRAGTNRSKAPRRAINHVVGAPFLAQQISMPSVLGPQFASDGLLSRYLGYKWQPQASPLDWRRNKLKS
jgi:ectoine hydroxylase-related dioxygenase (phytanoyl-CoA dioxygenase family)